MKIKIDELNIFKYKKLEDYVLQDSNAHYNSDCLKVTISNIGRVTQEKSKTTGLMYGYNIPVYKDIELDIREDLLTSEETDSLMEMLRNFKLREI